MNVKPKKHLGQHFLEDLSIAQRIANSLSGEHYSTLLEVGPGTGVLTQYLLKKKDVTTWVIEVDAESIAYLERHYPELKPRIIQRDFLELDWNTVPTEPIALIGNFPYNISSQIIFKMLEHKEHIPELVGMFQKEVAQRIASAPGNKNYGILSVLVQAYYSTEYLFSVPPTVFRPPPKVDSGVIRLKRTRTRIEQCDENAFKRVVKLAFNQRRKTLRNSLKSVLPSPDTKEHPLMGQRPEQLSVDQFIELTQLIGS